MESLLDDLRYKEHVLAEKAELLLQLQNELQSLKEKKQGIRQSKPVVEKDALTYGESIEFGNKMERYQQQLKRIEHKIKRKERELTGLEHQAQRLIPVSNIKIKVSKYSDGDSSAATFCIKYVNEGAQTGQFKVEKVSI